MRTGLGGMTARKSPSCAAVTKRLRGRQTLVNVSGKLCQSDRTWAGLARVRRRAATPSCLHDFSPPIRPPNGRVQPEAGVGSCQTASARRSGSWGPPRKALALSNGKRRSTQTQTFFPQRESFATAGLDCARRLRTWKQMPRHRGRKGGTRSAEETWKITPITGLHRPGAAVYFRRRNPSASFVSPFYPLLFT